MAQANEKKIIEQLDADQALRQNMETQKLSEESLDNIAGGTWKESSELVKEYNKKVSFLRETNIDGLAERLREMGIDAKISFGFYGIGSDTNTYRCMKTGKMLLHSEVVEFLRTDRKSWM